MELIIHIFIAVFGLIVSLFNIFSPKQSRITLSYSLLALTFATGTFLVFQHPAGLAHACISGLVYFAICLSMATYAQRKLKYSL